LCENISYENRHHHSPHSSWARFCHLWLQRVFQISSDADSPHNIAGDFLRALFVSHYVYAVAFCQVIGGLLLIIGRYVPLGLTILGPIIVNILLFHIFLFAEGLPMALLFAAVYLFLLWRYRAAFAGILRP
jgi:putative oxidoreductase